MFLKNCAQLPDIVLILTINFYVLRSEDILTNLTPPFEFPKHNSTFPFFIHNETILKLLLNRSEVDDLRKVTENEFVTSINSTRHESDKSPQNIDKKWQTELIEDGSNTEEVLKFRNISAPLVVKNQQEVGCQVGVIIAGVVFISAIIGYAGFLTWRRFVHKRLMGRQLLVNEEDYFEPNNMGVLRCSFSELTDKEKKKLTVDFCGIFI